MVVCKFADNQTTQNITMQKRRGNNREALIVRQLQGTIAEPFPEAIFSHTSYIRARLIEPS